MQIQIKPWLIIPILIVGLSIIFSMIRGCQKESLALATKWEQKTDSAIKLAIAVTREKDSAIQLYKDTLDFVNGQLALKNNQIVATKGQLDSADKRITELRARYQAIQPSTDTSVTVVPNEYVSNCADCFGELESGQLKVKQYMAQIDNLNQTYKSKINVQQNEIDFLNKKSDQYAEMLQTCIADSKKAESALKPKGHLYLAWGAIFGPLPKMAGAGLLYQNKYNVIWGAKWYYGSQGQMIEANINFPLSFNLFK